MFPIIIRIPGEPKGKGRARSRYIQPHGRPGFVVNYTPTATRSYEGEIKFFAQQEMKGSAPIEATPLKVSVDAIFSVPQSWSNKKRERALCGLIRPTGKPDADNILKTLDSLNKVVWRDDSQIVDARIRKLYGVIPALVITINEVEQLAEARAA